MSIAIEQHASWLAEIEADIATARRAIVGEARHGFGTAIARLNDTVHAELAERALETVGLPAAREDAGLALTQATRFDRRGLSDEALRWLVIAQSLVSPDESALAARIVFLLGLLHIRRAELTTARTVSEWGETFLGDEGERSADLLRLNAVLADANGERTDAERLYRRAIARSAEALTPLSRVIALHDLAETLSHSRPRESISLFGLALALIDANQLARGTRAAVMNGMGYALLCAGDVAEARGRLRAAAAEAAAAGRTRIELFALFNDAIGAELEGEWSESAQLLRDLSERARVDAPELAEWSALRLLWLALTRGDRPAVAAALASNHLRQLRAPYADTVRTLRALAMADGGDREALVELDALMTSYRQRGDELTAFVLELWLAWCQHVTGMTTVARRTFANACAVGAPRAFVVSPNWWSPRLVRLSHAMRADENAAYVLSWWLPSKGESARERTVVVERDTIVVDGDPVDASVWRRGKAGSRMLRRYFAALVAAHPAGLDRDELSDLLWPESDGDKAVRNLYWATRDLRDALAGIDGLDVVVREHRYRLEAASNVLVRA